MKKHDSLSPRITPLREVQSGYWALIQEPPLLTTLEKQFSKINIGIHANFGYFKFTDKLSYTTCAICGRSSSTLYCAEKYLHWSNKKTLCRSHALKLFYYSMPDKKGSK